MSKDITTQATNKMNIVGKLVSATFAEGKMKNGGTYERANLVIRVTQEYDGVKETSEIPVSMFASPYTTRGTANPAFESLQKVKNMKTVQNCGEAEADTVRMTNGSLQENNFVSRNSGQLINTWQIRNSFLNTTKMADIATFNVDIFILDMHDETDRDGDPTGRLVVKGGIVQYGGKLDVVEFIVEAPDKVNYIQRNWNINDTVNAGGRIRFTSREESRRTSESSWGESIPETSTYMVRELIITYGSDEPFDEDLAYSPDDIRKAFNVRKAELEQLQLDAKKGNAPKAAAAAAPAANASKYDWE